MIVFPIACLGSEPGGGLNSLFYRRWLQDPDETFLRLIVWISKFDLQEILKSVSKNSKLYTLKGYMYSVHGQIMPDAVLPALARRIFGFISILRNPSIDIFEDHFVARCLHKCLIY